MNNGQDIFSLQRTEAGLAYEKAMRNLKNLPRDVRDKVKNDLFQGLHFKSLAPGELYSNATIRSMSIQYANDDYIGDRLMQIVNVGDQPTGNFFTYDKRSRLQSPDDTMPERGIPNEIEDARNKTTFSCNDYGLSNSISAKATNAADAPLDELIDLTESILDVLALKRETRQATLLTTATNYASGNTTTLSGSSQWNSGTGGNPIADIQGARAACWTGRGPGSFVGFCSRSVWDVLARHPQLLDLQKYVTAGLLAPKALAAFFGLSDILVGDARRDTANEGRTASYSRIWGNYFGIVRVANRPSVRNASFAYTLRMFGEPKPAQWFEEKEGISGRYYAKVGISDDYRVCANEAGFLIVNPIV